MEATLKLVLTREGAIHRLGLGDGMVQESAHFFLVGGVFVVAGFGAGLGGIFLICGGGSPSSETTSVSGVLRGGCAIRVLLTIESLLLGRRCLRGGRLGRGLLRKLFDRWRRDPIIYHAWNLTRRLRHLASPLRVWWQF